MYKNCLGMDKECVKIPDLDRAISRISKRCEELIYDCLEIVRINDEMRGCETEEILSKIAKGDYSAEEILGKIAKGDYSIEYIRDEDVVEFYRKHEKILSMFGVDYACVIFKEKKISLMKSLIRAVLITVLIEIYKEHYCNETGKHKEIVA